MRIGIDVSRCIQSATGVGYYAKKLAQALAGIDSENDYLLYTSFCDYTPLGPEPADLPSGGNFRIGRSGSAAFITGDRRKSGGCIKDRVFGEVDIVHSTAYAMPDVDKLKTIVTMHDLSIYLYPHFHMDANYAFVNRNIQRAARHADCIIADSENTKKDIMRFLHVPEEKIEVIYLAASEGFSKRGDGDDMGRIRNSFGITGPYILAVGSVEPRKNLLRSLAAFKALTMTDGGRDYQFVLAGGHGWKNADFFDALRKLDIPDKIVITGYVSEDDLQTLYQGAVAFVYPSLYEGFGLPALEAMASGVPVITSNSSSLPEVAGDAALLVNPLEVFEIFEAMEALVESPQLRRELSVKGLEQSRKYSWQKTAQKTLEVYKQVYNYGKV
jgi:glycosyltransferase involved in cell wall biosynthesis